MTFYSQDGWTALHKASQEGHVDVVRALIEANARVNQQTTVFNVSIAKLAVFICSDRRSPHGVSVYPSSVNSCSIPFASLPALPSPPVLSLILSIHYNVSSSFLCTSSNSHTLSIPHILFPFLLPSHPPFLPVYNNSSLHTYRKGVQHSTWPHCKAMWQ